MEQSLLEDIIQYHFKNKQLISTALTHSSYVLCDKNQGEYNERMEFLGDAVLEIVVSDYLYRKINHGDEGELSKTRARMVCESALSKVAKYINLGSFLILGRGEDVSGGREKDSILSDALEALIGAIYLDSSLDEASKFIHTFIINYLCNKDIDINDKDFKSKLKELCDKHPGFKLEYMLVREDGPDHDKIFEYNVLLNNDIIGNGVGKSKQTASQLAAQNALKKMSGSNL